MSLHEPKPLDVVIVGTVCADLIFHGLPAFPRLGEEMWAKGLEVTSGGAINTAAALSRLGLHIGIATSLGTDIWSQQNLQNMQSEGLSTECIHYLDRPNPQLTVAMAYRDDRAFLSYSEPADHAAYQAHVHQIINTSSARHFHFYASSEPGHTDLLRAARAAGKSISLDCGWDPEMLRSDALLEQIRLADLFLPNLVEAQMITGRIDPSDALHHLARLAPTAVLKLGGNGAMALTRQKLTVASPLTVQVLDTTGAGDCFIAGFLYGWLQELPMEECLRIANFCGASCVAAVGGFSGAPTLAQLQDYLRGA